jgi:putative transposase
LLRDLKRRGMRSPVLAIGDGALGFWGAVRDVFPESREQRCWVHKIANVLDAVPTSLQPKVKAALHNIMNAEDKDAAASAIEQFQATYGAKYPKAVDKIVKDREVLLTHFDFPIEHWIHLRTTNVIESTFATVRLRTNKTKGAGSRSAGLAMAFKLLDAAQVRWRCVNAPHLVAALRAEASSSVDTVVIDPEDQPYAA